MVSSNTRICTGHISKAPSEYTFLVEKGAIDIVHRQVTIIQSSLERYADKILLVIYKIPGDMMGFFVPS